KKLKRGNSYASHIYLRIFSSGSKYYDRGGFGDAPTTFAASTLNSASFSIRSVKVAPKPPAGFNPVTASNKALEHYGFPTRPTHLARLKAWTAAVFHAKHEVAPNPILGRQYIGRPRSQTFGLSGTSYGEWAGYTDIGSDGGNIKHDNTYANWDVSSIPGDSSYANSEWETDPTVGFWTGIGGATSNSDSIIHAGTADIATTIPQYRCWTEDYPDDPVYEGPVINPEDEVFVEVTYNGDGTTSYFLENTSTGNYSSFTNSTPYYDDTSADFVAEVKGAYLPDFYSTEFTNCSTMWSNGTASGNFDDQAYEKVIMTNSGTSGGTIMAEPGGVNTGNDGFAVDWINYA
ncbi:MAG TPA: hypothetical protein DD856_09490, partial [Sulfobacillus sp.]|nr:hypothetical protein [Sulfobacillus sp.]